MITPQVLLVENQFHNRQQNPPMDSEFRNVKVNKIFKNIDTKSIAQQESQKAWQLFCRSSNPQDDFAI